MSQRRASTRRSLMFQHDFAQLWVGDTISQFGTQVSIVAVPYLAVTVLGADEFQMGLLTTLEFIGFLLIGLPAGAWVDRWRRKPVLVSSDIIRAVALGSIPAAFFLGSLTFVHLCIVALIASIATVFFDVAYQSYLPSIVDRDQITEGNSKLETSRSVAQVAGPGIAGGLIKIAGAPLVVLLDAVSYLFSAAFITRIRHEEPAHDKSTRRSLRVEIAEGLLFVIRHPLLSRIAACTALANMFSAIVAALSVLYLVRDLGLDPRVIGLVFSAAAIGGLFGALSAAQLARRFGEGRIIPLSALLFGPFSLLMPLAVFGWTVPMLILGGFGVSFSVVVYNVAQVSFRQRMCPALLLGRMNASIRFLVWGTLPIGALAGGLIGNAYSILTALWIAAAGSFLAALPVAFSPLIGMRKLPVGLDAQRD